MKNTSGFLVIFFFLFFASLAWADPPTAAQSHQDQSIFQRCIDTINDCQQILKQKMTVIAKDLKKNRRPKTLCMLLILSFLYGAVHAIGPGHGKSIVLSYLMSFRGSTWKGIMTGAVAAFFHGLSAIILVLAIYYLSIKRVSTTFDNVSTSLMTISYLLIIALGIMLFSIRVYELIKTRGSYGSSKDKGVGSPAVMILSLGLVPCPGAMIILLFFMSMRLLHIGIWMAICMSAGMALSVALVALLGLGTKNTLFNISHQQGTGRRILLSILEIGAPVIIIMIGTFLLYTHTMH